MTAPLPDYYLMRTKDVITLTGSTKYTAEQVLKDIKDWIKEKTGVATRFVTFSQYQRYFSV